MSGRRGVAGRLLGRRLLALYPEAWRARYREEVLALMDDDPPTPGGLASLLLGAADAHLRPRSTWLSSSPPQTRMRLSVGAMFACWIALSLAGAAFAKETEGPAFALAGGQHLLLALSRWAIILGAAAGACAIAVGGLPLLAQALVAARRERDLRQAGLLALAPGALSAFAVLTLAIAARARVHPAAVTAGPAILGPWLAAGLACAVLCALAPRLVMRRARPCTRALRRACLAGWALVAAMALVSAGLACYDLALLTLAPGLAAQSGPWPSTGLVLALAAALAGLSSVLALLSAGRAHSAARQAGQAR